MSLWKIGYIDQDGKAFSWRRPFRQCEIGVQIKWLTRKKPNSTARAKSVTITPFTQEEKQ